MQIHHIEVTQQFIEDPDHKGPGKALIRREVRRASGVHQIVNAEHGTYEINDDMTFDVPLPLAYEMLRRPGWFGGDNPFYDPDNPTAPPGTTSRTARTPAEGSRARSAAPKAAGGAKGAEKPLTPRQKAAAAREERKRQAKAEADALEADKAAAAALAAQALGTPPPGK